MIRLANYQVPNFLIDALALTFDLGETDTKVAARLDIRRNPEATDRTVALHLDGEAVELVSVTLTARAW